MSAANTTEPAARLIGGTRPVRWRMTTPAQPQSAAPVRPASVASISRGVSSIGPSLTMSAMPISPSTKPATRRGPSGSFNTGAAMMPLHNGTMPFITAR